MRKALSIEPKFWNAIFNLAEIAFLRKDWTEARNRFEALLAEEPRDAARDEPAHPIQDFAHLCAPGKENTVDWILNQFELAKESPALYYSNAAIAFQNGNEKEATEWMSTAKKHFATPLNRLFAESFYEIGWMERPAGESPAALEITSEERAERLKQMRRRISRRPSAPSNSVISMAQQNSSTSRKRSPLTTPPLTICGAKF